MVCRKWRSFGTLTRLVPPTSLVQQLAAIQPPRLFPDGWRQVPDADFSRLLERAEKYEAENPVLGFTAFSVYSHMYLAMSCAALAELDTRQVQSSVSLATTPELTEAA